MGFTSWLTSRPSAEFSDTLGLGKIRGFWEFLIFYKDNPTIIRGLELDLVIMQLATYYGKKESCRRALEIDVAKIMITLPPRGAKINC